MTFSHTRNNHHYYIEKQTAAAATTNSLFVAVMVLSTAQIFSPKAKNKGQTTPPQSQKLKPKQVEAVGCHDF